MAETAHVTSVPPVWGMFLHLCAEARGARTVLELGSGAGLSGCYLGSAEGCRRFVTVEGSAERARLARAHLAEVVPHAEVVVDSFQSALADILPGLEEGLDLVFIDGNKDGGGYLDLVERLAARLNPGAVLIFDDRPAGRLARALGEARVRIRDQHRPIRRVLVGGRQPDAPCRNPLQHRRRGSLRRSPGPPGVARPELRRPAGARPGP